LYFRARRAAWVIGAVVGFLVLVGVNLQVVFPKAAVERVEETYEGRDMVYVPQLGMELELSAASRVFYAQAALEMIKESPIWGVGFGTFIHRVQRYLDPSIYSKRNVAHNMFLQVTSEMGLLGLAAFLWIIVRAIRIGRWLYRYADRDTEARTLGVGLIAITVGLMVTNLFGNRFFNGMIVGYYFIIVALATRILMTLQEDATAKDLEPQGGIDTWSRKPSTLPA
jgi:O-antigen ligase